MSEGDAVQQFHAVISKISDGLKAALPPTAFDEQHPYFFTADHPVVKIFKTNGFIWGGDFTHRKDSMYFQFARGY